MSRPIDFRMALPEELNWPAFQDMLIDFAHHQETRWEPPEAWSEARFKAFVAAEQAKQIPGAQPPGRVAGIRYWALDPADQILAYGTIRLSLNAHLRELGGHIGYTVVPRFRQRGIGKRFFAAQLDMCRELGLGPVLVTCDEDNLASRKIIESQDARYEDRRFAADRKKWVNRYWVG